MKFLGQQIRYDDDCSHCFTPLPSGGELSPFLSANSNVQHEPKSYLKAVEKNEETI